MLSKSVYCLKRVIFCVVLYFTFVCNVYAIQVVTYTEHGNSGYSVGGSGSRMGCNGNTACFRFNGSIPASGFRFTLVDSSGKKVAGTKSVDFTGDSRLFSDFKSGFSLISVNGKQFNYKYGTNSGSNSSFNLYYDNDFPTISNIKKIEKQIENYKNYKNIEFNGKKISFLEFILVKSGFLQENRPEIEQNHEKVQEIRANNYYLIYEPTILMYVSNKHFYGTVSEFADAIYVDGLSDSFRRNAGRIRQKAGCVVYTDSGSDFNNITNKTYSSYCSYDQAKAPSSSGGKWYKRDIEYIHNDSYGYAIGVMKLKDKMPECIGFICEPDDVPVESNSYVSNFVLNLCGTNGENIVTSDGKVTFDTSNMRYLSSKTFKNDLFKVSGDDPNSSIYCYDSVSYDFSGTINDLQMNRNILSDFNVTPGKLSITRLCSIPSHVPYKIEDNLSDYLNNEIYLDYGGNQYKFQAEITSKDTYKDFDNKYVFEVDIEYKINNGIQLGSTSKVKDAQGKIIFKDALKSFGNSNSLINKYINNGTINIENGNDNYSYSVVQVDGSIDKNSTEFSCDFRYSVDDDKTNVIFRTISLDNPFPARDGTSRLPGYNWLSSNNYVNDYILNNRGVVGITKSNDVSPQEMYDNENIKPMYSFVLDTQTMLSIREYNKTHDYTDYDLDCVDGRQCYSKFIRSELSSSHIENSDSCFLTSANDDIRSKFSKLVYSVNDIDYNGVYDDNDDLIMDSRKNTQFYSCANKTYKSGGPVSDEGGGN